VGVEIAVRGMQTSIGRPHIRHDLRMTFTSGGINRPAAPDATGKSDLPEYRVAWS
jgi:hypothetical protein